MNRLALFCTVGLVALTLAAFVDHIRHRELPGKEPPAELTAPAGAALVAPPTRPPVEAVVETVDLDALRARVETSVLEPLRTQRLHAGSFSRVRMPAPIVDLEMEDEVRPPKEGGGNYIVFRVRERRGLEPRRAAGQPLAIGRIETTTGRIELAPGRVLDPSAVTFVGLADGLKRLGVREGKRPW